MHLVRLIAAFWRFLRRCIARLFQTRSAPMPITEFPKIDARFTSRLGQIIINWAVIENWMGHLLGTIINADLGGASILTREMGAATVIKAIKIVISINEPKQPDLKLVRELIEEADE